VNVNSTAACVRSRRVRERTARVLLSTLLDLLLSRGSHSSGPVTFSTLGWKNCDCQKVVLIGTSDLKIIL